jgi:hypothetical protein
MPWRKVEEIENQQQGPCKCKFRAADEDGRKKLGTRQCSLTIPVSTTGGSDTNRKEPMTIMMRCSSMPL